MPPRLVDSLRLRGPSRIFGRDAELRLFSDSLACECPSVNVFLVHGPGGVGKTTLLEEMRALALATGMDCVRLDGRDIEPSAYGVLKGLGLAMGMDAAEPARLPVVLALWREQPRRLLMIDTFEHLSHLAHWLRDHVLANLPEQSLVVMAGRTAPDDFWRTDPIWRNGCRVMGLRNLSSEDADGALAARGLDAPRRQAIMRLTYGHPLALMLLADAVDAHADVPDTLGPDVIRRLIDCFAAQLPSPLHRDALDICAHARVTDEHLLACTVNEAAAPALFDWLASLSFMAIRAEGLVPHDLVRDAISSELRWRRPQRQQQLTNQLLQYHLARARTTASPEHQRATLDIFYLNRGSPLMQQFIDFANLGKVCCDPATPEDVEPIAALVRQELGPEHEALLRHWHGHPAATLWSVRDTRHEIAAAMLCLDVSALAPEALSDDPGMASFTAWLSHQPPLRPDEVVLFARLSVARGGIAHGASFINAMQARSVSLWMSVPRLAIYAMATAEPAHWAPMMGFIDFHPVDAAGFTMDGQPQGNFVHDWRRVPLQEWLGQMTMRMLQPDMPMPPDAKAAPLQVLSEPLFRDALQQALRDWPHHERFCQNPLLQSRLVRSARKGLDEAPEATLRRLIHNSVEVLSQHPRHFKFARALELTYLRPAGSQELAAERLGLPYGTYRYQLRMALERVTSALWAHEIGAVQSD